MINSSNVTREHSRTEARAAGYKAPGNGLLHPERRCPRPPSRRLSPAHSSPASWQPQARPQFEDTLLA
ncbi:hypothetical protein NDU88_001383 [Pleurodeles waltl]|uniref:Uncharacterized protein n=1 Tax=Pleurodeles waltl TaxID=8319 RepID=A0AAV7LXI4_PLEWA|nr:hypothetical protein NDU88_001383 [Pleurodeles waltl]